MFILIVGLVIFLGTHAFTMFRGAREKIISRIGAKTYRLAYTIKSALGLVLIVIGFGRARAAGQAILYAPPLWLHDVTAVLMWLAFISLACMGRPAGRIKGLLHHPMLVGIKLWAFGHLLSNGDAAGVLLFGAFLAWAVIDRISVKRRGDAGAIGAENLTRADGVAIIAGTIVFFAMFWLHRYLIGVPVYLA